MLFLRLSCLDDRSLPMDRNICILPSGSYSKKMQCTVTAKCKTTGQIFKETQKSNVILNVEKLRAREEIQFLDGGGGFCFDIASFNIRTTTYAFKIACYYFSCFSLEVNQINIDFLL